ncbi:MAG: exodeoxyribonuclease VII small subunit [Planctomycetota bacterium]|nr:MAG: exodeoxyribonuclease VII small subunit [Planctomycetota bacterium]REJ94405.1 MAG: exodeoxyribonuclease VII small subunit [Planctomycetota bacterium]REK22062.1 MAG: exodeoxyribonuclease VII small subunit [Planctomycetota bacterium]
MAKKKAKSASTEALTFEASLTKLEAIVGELEKGEIGLAEAMARYEEGVKLLAACYKQLEGAEAQIELLSGVDAEGKAVTEPFEDEATDSLDDKAASRSRRRTAKKSARPTSDEAGDIDTSGSLF